MPEIEIEIPPQTPAEKIQALKEKSATNFKQEGWDLKKKDHRIQQFGTLLGLHMVEKDWEIQHEAQKKHDNLMDCEDRRCESGTTSDDEGEGEVVPSLGDQTTINYHEAKPAPAQEDPQLAMLRQQVAAMQAAQAAPAPEPSVPAKAVKTLGPVALSLLGIGTGLGGAGIVGTAVYQAMKPRTQQVAPAPVDTNTDTDTAIRLFPDEPIMPGE